MSAGEFVETPLWFGPVDRPLFGWVTRPTDGVALGGLVIAPTLGLEARASRRALQLLARAAARRGFASVRIDYDGTGDSAGHFEDPGRDDAWTSSVAAAVDLLRQCGLASVSAVGLRLGAVVAGCAAARHSLGLEGLVLWDPCDSARTYLRELSALEALRRERGRMEVEGAVVTAEHLFPPEMVAELRQLDLSRVEDKLARRVLVVQREDRPPLTRLERGLTASEPEWRTTDEQRALLDVDPLFATMPLGAIDEIAEWLAGSAADPVEMAAVEGTSAVRLHVGDATVTERVASLGPRGLFGIVTEPLDGAGPGPLVVLLNTSNEDHTGPSRLWVELSRRWAAHGLRCVRFDLTGLGDSPDAPDGPPTSVFEQVWLDDAVAVPRQLVPTRPDDTVFVGLCSGALWAVEAGRSLGATGVCAINPPIGIDFLHGVMRLGASRRRWVRSIAERMKYGALHLRWVAATAWKFLRFLVPSVFSVDVLRETADGGSELLVLASRDDLSPFPERHRFERFFGHRLLRPHHYDVTFVDELDHSMHDPEGRRRAVELLDRHVLGHFAPPTHDRNDEEHP